MRKFFFREDEIFELLAYKNLLSGAGSYNASQVATQLQCRNFKFVPSFCRDKSDDNYVAFCDESPDIIVIVQSYPDQFPPDLMNRIRRCWSIIPVILFLGCGNVGELRTGTPHSGCFRIYVYEWNNFWNSQLKKYAANERSIFDLPPTCGDDEIFLEAAKNNLTNLSYKNSKKNNANNGVCLIVSNYGALGNDYAMNKLLADYASSLGYSCEFNPQNLCTSPKLVLIDADDCGFSRIIESVQRLRRLFADSEFNVYINSPQLGEIVELRAAGVVGVIPKPFFW
ncbi:MAG: hypothetical protein LBP59_07510 [Planctomycetaceae bacterium]|nr:hypothetical protein [Planctomycetaceae bacterium]